MQEYRCHNDNYLLYKADNDPDTEIVCPSCHRVNYPSRTRQEIGLRGLAFQSKAVDIRDPRSNGLLLRVIGTGIIEIKPRKGENVWKFEVFRIETPKYQVDRFKVRCLNATPEDVSTGATNKKKLAI